MNLKIELFEYTISHLINWYEEVHPEETIPRDVLSKLKAFKLHFFVCAINAKSGDEKDLTNLYDNFSALPYGHVESDVYDNLGRMRHYTLGNGSIQYIDGILKPLVHKNILLHQAEEAEEAEVIEYIDMIDKSIISLREINDNLISETAIELVELSHKWFSWITFFKKARSINKFSMPIPSSVIKIESKFFY